MAAFKIRDQYRDNLCLNDAYADLTAYCLNAKKTPGRYVRGHYAGTEDPGLEMELISNLYMNNSGRRLRHTILSFAPEENILPQEADEIAGEIMAYYSGHQMISAVHEDKDHVHVHFVMNITDFRDGSKYPSSKEAYYAEQRHFKRVLRKHGVYALQTVKWQ